MPGPAPSSPGGVCSYGNGRARRVEARRLAAGCVAALTPALLPSAAGRPPAKLPPSHRTKRVLTSDAPAPPANPRAPGELFGNVPTL